MARAANETPTSVSVPRAKPSERGGSKAGVGCSTIQRARVATYNRTSWSIERGDECKSSANVGDTGQRK